MTIITVCFNKIFDLHLLLISVLLCLACHLKQVLNIRFFP